MTPNILLYQTQLLALIEQHCILTGEVALSSGGKSNVFFDLKRILLQPEGLHLVSRIMLYKAREGRATAATAVAGPVVGACPIVAGMVYESYLNSGDRLSGFYVRRQRKNTGTHALIDGLDICNHKFIVLVEDVTTTGGSLIRAMHEVYHQSRGRIVKALTVIDREEGAGEALGEYGIPLEPLFTMSEILS